MNTRDANVLMILELFSFDKIIQVFRELLTNLKFSQRTRIIIVSLHNYNDLNENMHFFFFFIIGHCTVNVINVLFCAKNKL